MLETNKKVLFSDITGLRKKDLLSISTTQDIEEMIMMALMNKGFPAATVKEVVLENKNCHMLEEKVSKVVKEVEILYNRCLVVVIVNDFNISNGFNNSNDFHILIDINTSKS